jgi:hypothetical protein
MNIFNQGAEYWFSAVPYWAFISAGR